MNKSDIILFGNNFFLLSRIIANITEFLLVNSLRMKILFFQERKGLQRLVLAVAKVR